MMTQPLFHTYDEEFIEKTAGEVDLPDDPNQWAQSILQELYKQVPYITDYQPHVEMQRVDAERGYGMGHAEIQNQTEAPMDADPDSLEAAGIRSVRIPFVIREKKLSPFDLLVNDLGKVIPLTENRLRQSLFRAQAFDVTSRTPGDQSMIGQLYPPYRQNYGFGGGGISAGSMGMGKVGSARTSLLVSILPTITQADKAHFEESLAKEAGYLFSVNRMSCEGFSDILSSVVESEPEQVKVGSWRSWVPESVVQVRRAPGDPGGYVVKTASHYMWDPEVYMMDRGEVVRRFGVKIAMDADTTGAVTLASGANTVGEEKESNLVPVTEPGLYKVSDSTGKEHIGFVIPQLVDTDGELTPLALFTNGTVAAVQSDIYGERSGDGLNLPSGPVGGNGAFYTVTEDGVRMTVPFEFQDSYTMEDQPKVFSGQTFDGRPVEVSVQPNIVDVTPSGEGRVLIPENWLWLPMDGAQTVSLVNSDEASALGAEDKMACVQLRGDGESFHISGIPVTKLAASEKNWLSLDDAMFLLAGLGVDQEHGVKKLAAAAAFGDTQSVRVGRLVEPFDGQWKEATAKARELVDSVSQLKQPLLLKEAATFPDPTTVDVVLSLGFINPENIMSFVSYLPDLDDVQTKLCELLFSVRLGLKNIPQTSLERAVRSLEETIEGLKVLGFQGS